MDDSQKNEDLMHEYLEHDAYAKNMYMKLIGINHEISELEAKCGNDTRRHQIFGIKFNLMYAQKEKLEIELETHRNNFIATNLTEPQQGELNPFAKAFDNDGTSYSPGSYKLVPPEWKYLPNIEQ
jgi:hypothetical protein